MLVRLCLKLVPRQLLGEGGRLFSVLELRLMLAVSKVIDLVEDRVRRGHELYLRRPIRRKLCHVPDRFCISTLHPSSPSDQVSFEFSTMMVRSLSVLTVTIVQREGEAEVFF